MLLHIETNAQSRFGVRRQASRGGGADGAAAAVTAGASAGWVASLHLHGIGLVARSLP